MRWVNSRRSGSVGHEGNEAGIRTRDVEKGVRQNRRSDFGRCSAAATVRSEAEDEERSDEQSLPLRHALGKFSSVWISSPLAQRIGDNALKGGPEAIETSLIGGSANRNSPPQLAEIDHCVEITFLQDAVIDAVDVDEDRSERVIARFRNAADLAIDLRDHGTL